MAEAWLLYPLTSSSSLSLLECTLLEWLFLPTFLKMQPPSGTSSAACLSSVLLSMAS